MLELFILFILLLSTTFYVVSMILLYKIYKQIKRHNDLKEQNKITNIKSDSN